MIDGLALSWFSRGTVRGVGRCVAIRGQFWCFSVLLPFSSFFCAAKLVTGSSHVLHNEPPNPHPPPNPGSPSCGMVGAAGGSLHICTYIHVGSLIGVDGMILGLCNFLEFGLPI